ncbi:MAG: GyrI-like domain-containing protein [Chloroflexota bacterium]|nr:GyrI-like domain-containing protein [Chloroflexota bacterium]
MAAEQNNNDVELRQLEPQPTLIIRGTIQVADLGATVGERLGALSSYLQQSGARPAGPPFVRYHTFGDTHTDFELGVPLVEPVAGEGEISRGELPGGPAATTWHTGPHVKLGEAYARIAAWLQEQEREPSGPAWEVYHWIDLSGENDPSTSDQSSGTTQLVQPIT